MNQALGTHQGFPNDPKIAHHLCSPHPNSKASNRRSFQATLIMDNHITPKIFTTHLTSLHIHVKPKSCLLHHKRGVTEVYHTAHSLWSHGDRIPSTTPGAEPPRDDRDSGSARSHSTHLETSSSDRPKMVTYTEPQTVSSYMSVECTRRTLHMPIFTLATHAEPSLSNFPWRDSDFWRADPLTRDDPGGTKFSHFPPK